MSSENRNECNLKGFLESSLFWALNEIQDNPFNSFRINYVRWHDSLCQISFYTLLFAAIITMLHGQYRLELESLTNTSCHQFCVSVSLTLHFMLLEEEYA